MLFTTPSGEYWTHGNFSKSAAQSGATLAELMARLGHSTSAAAMRYQHAAAGRDVEIAAALSRMALADVVPLAGRGTRGAGGSSADGGTGIVPR